MQTQMQHVTTTNAQLCAVITNATAALQAVQAFAQHVTSNAYAAEDVWEDINCNAAMQLHLFAISEDLRNLCSTFNVDPM